MSNALGIAAVTAVLKDLLKTGIADRALTGIVGEVIVSALPPDRLLVEGQPETGRLNLFMYKVTPNQGWRNAAVPARDAAGQRIGSPPLALDLHYLVTAYGAAEFEGEILLGYAMQILHDTPVLTRESIRRTLAPAVSMTPGGAVPLSGLIASELAEQAEQIRITPQTTSAEEMSNLWAAIRSHYRPSAAYLASVVMIESRRP